MPASLIDPALALTCPRCGQPNACAMTRPAAGPHTPCWCRNVRVPRSLRDAEPARWGPACFCEACIRAAQAEDQAQIDIAPQGPPA